MDILATQVYEDNDFTSTDKLSASQHEGAQVGALHIGPDTYSVLKGINKIGRHPACNVVLNDQTVSKHHAEIEANSRDTSAWVCDLHSSNKTKLNNSVLRPGRCYELKDGSKISFGMVDAIYKVHRPLDDSMVPETPARTRRVKEQFVIPGTPDSSLNNSSSLSENVSMIPGTQANDSREYVFRRPSMLSSRNSTNSDRKSFVQDSSIDDSIDDSRSFSERRNENVGEQRVSIHDMETQESLSAPIQTDVDIHDVETQKICLSAIKVLQKSRRTINQQSNIHEMETQNDEDREVQGVTDIHDVETQNDSDIHDVETQGDIDIHDMMTPKRIDKQSSAPRNANDSVRGGERSSTESTEKRKSKVCNSEGESIGAKESGPSKNEASTKAETTTHAETRQKFSQEYLALSLTTSFEDDCSELERSRNMLGSPNLLEDFVEDDELPEEVIATASTPKVARPNDDGKADSSAEEESIFDAATQVQSTKEENVLDAVTQRVKYKFKAALVDNDSDDTTDGEGVLLRYSREEAKTKEKPSKNQSCDSDDSDTDEEGRFTEIALQEKRVSSISTESRQNESKEAKNDAGSSGDSEDLFDIPTQRLSSKNRKSFAKMIENDNADVDYDIPTQIIDVDKPEDIIKIGEDEDIEEIDDIAPTQLIPTNESPVRVNNRFINARSKPVPIVELQDITEMEDHTAVQILSDSENVSDDVDSPNDKELSNVEQFSVEDIDYEMAPTQLISEKEKRKSVSLNNSAKKGAQNRVKLDDTVERNLNDMFDDVNECDAEDQPLMSTQVLTNMLQSSQCEVKLSMSDARPDDNLGCVTESAESNTVKKSPRGTTSKETVVEPASPLLSNRKSRRSNFKNRRTDNDSENAKNYSSPVLSRRKRSVLIASQETPNSNEKPSDDTKEEKVAEKSEDVALNDNNNSVCLTPQRSTPKISSTPRSSRKSKNKESKLHETIIEKADLSEGTKDASEESSKKEGTLTPGASAKPEQSPRASKVANPFDDEDILAGLPEFRIAGTLSYPASPTSTVSSEFRLRRKNIRAKKELEKTLPKRRAPRKSARQTYSRRASEVFEPYRTVSKPNLSNVLGSLSNTLPSNVDVDKVMVHESDDKKTSRKSVQPVRKMSARRSRKSNATERDSPLQQKAIPKNNLQKHASQSPSIQSNGGTRESSKENLDRSSVFQVGKEATATVVEPAKLKGLIALRFGKRAHSTTDAMESGDAKKRKGDANEGQTVVTKGRKSNAQSTKATRRHSENILNFVTKRNSPPNVENSQRKSQSTKSPFNLATSMSKEIMIKIVRMSPTESTESAAGNSQGEKNQASVNNRMISNDSAKAENEKPEQNRRTRRTVSQKITAKGKDRAEEISGEVGEESQEVEMIMNATLQEQSANLEIEKRKHRKGGAANTRARSTRKRANVDVLPDVDVEDTSVSSDVSESDNARFEMPTARPKRPKITKNAPKITNNAANEPTSGTKRSSRQTSRSTRSQQPLATDSSVDETVESAANNTVNTVNTNKKRGQPKAKKVEAEKRQSENYIEETVSSEMNSSVDTTSIISTPTRIRRSLSSSFAMSSPSKVKHRILFTGIPSDDYSKLLTKLGSSQVEDPTKCSVLVTDKVRRTVKFLCALAQSVPIVSVDWLIESEKAGKFVNLENYILKDPAAEVKFGFKLRGSLEKAKGKKLLDGYTVVLTQNVAPPPLPELKSIIASCGGKALVRPPSSWPQKAVIISREEDLANAKKLLVKAPKTVTVQSTEFLLTGILRQELNFVKYKLI